MHTRRTKPLHLQFKLESSALDIRDDIKSKELSPSECLLEYEFMIFMISWKTVKIRNVWQAGPKRGGSVKGIAFWGGTGPE